MNTLIFFCSFILFLSKENPGISMNIGGFFQNIYIEGQFYGNLLRSDALTAFHVAERILVQEPGASPMLSVQHLHTRGYKLKTLVEIPHQGINDLSCRYVILHFITMHSFV